MPSWGSTAVFFQQLAATCDAGLAGDRAVELAGAAAGGRWTGLAAGWARRMQAGSPLSGAMAADGIDAHACAVVRAGEAGGRLPELCRQLAAGYELRAKLRDEALGRLAYPVLLLHAALIVPVLPGVILGTTPAWRLLLGPGILYGAVLGLWLAGRGAGRAGLLARLALRWPLAGLVWPALAADLAAVLRAGLSAGMLTSDALELAAGACAHPLVAARLRQAAADLRQRRIPDLTTALQQAGLPAMDLALIATGERAGTLEATCGRLWTVNAERFALRLGWTCKAATGAIYGIAMLLAALAVLGMYQQVYAGPLRDLTESME